MCTSIDCSCAHQLCGAICALNHVLCTNVGYSSLGPVLCTSCEHIFECFLHTSTCHLCTWCVRVVSVYISHSSVCYTCEEPVVLQLCVTVVVCYSCVLRLLCVTVWCYSSCVLQSCVTVVVCYSSCVEVVVLQLCGGGAYPLAGSDLSTRMDWC